MNNIPVGWCKVSLWNNGFVVQNNQTSSFWLTEFISFWPWQWMIVLQDSQWLWCLWLYWIKQIDIFVMLWNLTTCRVINICSIVNIRNKSLLFTFLAVPLLFVVLVSMETVDVVDDVIDWEGVVVVYSCWSKAEIKIIVVLQTHRIS